MLCNRVDRADMLIIGDAILRFDIRGTVNGIACDQHAE
jgi:hypothetical protein